MERALLLSGGKVVGPEDLALHESPAIRVTPSSAPSMGGALPFPATLEAIERAAARLALERCDGNKSEAARLLGTTRTRLYRLLKEEDEAEDV